MKNFNELRNEINEAKKKKPCTDCEKKEKAAAKAAAKKKKEMNAFYKEDGESTQLEGPQGVNH